MLRSITFHSLHLLPNFNRLLSPLHLLVSLVLHRCHSQKWQKRRQLATAIKLEYLWGRQLEILSELFSLNLSEYSGTRSLLHDFLELVAQGMGHLWEAGRSNVIYSLAKAVCKCARMALIHFYRQSTCQWDSVSMQSTFLLHKGILTVIMFILLVHCPRSALNVGMGKWEMRNWKQGNVERRKWSSGFWLAPVLDTWWAVLLNSKSVSRSLSQGCLSPV